MDVCLKEVNGRNTSVSYIEGDHFFLLSRCIKICNYSTCRLMESPLGQNVTSFV